MADIRQSFPTLEDSGTQAGLPLHKILEGDSLTSKNALAAFGFKNAAGQARYAKVDSSDRVILSPSTGDFAGLWERGELAAGSATFADVTGATITLQTSYDYQDVAFAVSCRRNSHFQIIWDDDGSETILADIVLEAGESFVSSVIKGLNFQAGATGTQELKIKAKNFEALSALRGTIIVSEVQP